MAPVSALELVFEDAHHHGCEQVIAVRVGDGNLLASQAPAGDGTVDDFGSCFLFVRPGVATWRVTEMASPTGGDCHRGS